MIVSKIIKTPIMKLDMKLDAILGIKLRSLKCPGVHQKLD
jgi:hypothetical protein